MRGRKGSASDGSGVRCPSRDYNTRLQCQEISGHAGYHRHLTPAQSAAWGISYGTRRR